MAAFTCPNCSCPGPFEHILVSHQAITVGITGTPEDGYVARIPEGAVASENAYDDGYRCASCNYEFDAGNIRLQLG